MISKAIRSIAQNFGYDIIKQKPEINTDRSNPIFQEIVSKVSPYTMTSIDRMWALHNACNYISQNKIQGDFVECGVWRGGSAMLAALSFLSKNDADRMLYMYDTFEGMTEPGQDDVSMQGESAASTWQNVHRCLADYADVEQNILSTGYSSKKIKMIQGKVEDTIPSNLPNQIALLRLDTDWYDSTYHELVHLYPLLVKGGVIIIDDYGHWQGARKAVDQYFSENNIPILLNWIDYTGRIAIKM